MVLLSTTVVVPLNSPLTPRLLSPLLVVMERLRNPKEPMVHLLSPKEPTERHMDNNPNNLKPHMERLLSPKERTERLLNLNTERPLPLTALRRRLPTERPRLEATKRLLLRPPMARLLPPPTARLRLATVRPHPRPTPTSLKAILPLDTTTRTPTIAVCL